MSSANMQLSGSEAVDLSSVPADLYIGGIWRPSETGQRFAVFDPATETELTRVADATTSDASQAMDAAADAQGGWAATPARARADLLRSAYELILERRDLFAELMTAEMGKPLRESEAEVDYGASFLRWFADRATSPSGRSGVSPEGNLRMLVARKPVGPCLLVTPWNFPLAMATRKIGPALAAGCTVIVKPAQLTPLTTLLLGSVFHEIGLPGGVLNIIPTTSASEVVNPLIGDERLRKVSFTGSTEVGSELLRLSATRVLRSSMELGGNAPFVVFDDADLDVAIEAAVSAKLRNMGEACTAANRFLVQNGIHDEFVARFADRLAGLKLGPGRDPESDLGPIINVRSRDEIHAKVVDAIDRGAKLITGGVIPGGPGAFYPPTVLAAVPRHAPLVREEIFGPVAPIMAFDTEQEAIDLANDTEYGLASYLITRDIERVFRFADNVETGMLGVNTGVISNPAAPFGGVKRSGVGREGSSEGIDEYQELQYIGLPNANRSV